MHRGWPDIARHSVEQRLEGEGVAPFQLLTLPRFRVHHGHSPAFCVKRQAKTTGPARAPQEAADVKAECSCKAGLPRPGCCGSTRLFASVSPCARGRPEPPALAEAGAVVRLLGRCEDVSGACW